MLSTRAAQNEPGVIPHRAPRVKLGVVTYCFSVAAKASAELAHVPKYQDPAVFIREAARLGASAVQIPFGVLPSRSIAAIRAVAEESRIALESTLGIPGEQEMDRFDAEMRTLRDLGVTVVRTVLFAGRRYEDYPSPDAYAAALRNARSKVERAEPVARKYGLRLAIENHKDQRIDERVAFLQEFGGEHIGACIDVGNNLALLEDPLTVVEALLPWAFTVHFKDQGVRECDDGFLLADVPLGEGCIDLPGVIDKIRASKPNLHLQLELITRDPLLVPILASSYWKTLENVKAPAFSAAWDLVKKRGARDPFPTISNLPLTEKIAAERRNIELSFAFAATHLGLTA